MRRSLALGAAAICVILGGNLLTSQSALARELCSYIAHDASGQYIADGSARASKMSTACDRARRRCNRELERKWRQGKAGRSTGCHRMVQG